MARYTPEFLASVRHCYENTDEPMRSIAARHEIGITTLQTLVEKQGWAKRSQRTRDCPSAMQLLDEARALATSTLSSQSGGESWPAPQGASRDGGLLDLNREAPPTPDPSPPLASLTEGGEQEATRSPTMPLAGRGNDGASGGGSAAIDRIEALVTKEIAAEEAARGALGMRPRGRDAGRAARTLSILTQTLHTLQRMRGGAPIEPDKTDDDPVPEDMDQFRFELARRIDAFVASRTAAAEAAGNSGPAEADEGR